MPTRRSRVVAGSRGTLAAALALSTACFGGSGAGGAGAGSGAAGTGGTNGGSGGSGAGGIGPTAGATVEDFGGVPQAIEAATAAEVTSKLVLQGDGVGARYDLLLSGGVPAADALIAEGEAAIDPLAAEFELPDAYQRDEALVVVAFILGKIGSPRALGPLADFLDRALAVDLPLQSANAATDAVLEILETTGHGGTPSDRNDSYWYTITEMESAISFARIWADLESFGQALTFRGGKCEMRYVFRDASGNTLECPDDKGIVGPCVIPGVVFEDVTKVSKESIDLHNEAQMNGAKFPMMFDNGAASRRYNCAGYAFREINRYVGWTGAAVTMQKKLVEMGLLRKKSGDPKPGDKVFFRPIDGWEIWEKNAPAHVAEVDRIENGKPILRAPDNFSGIFDLALDAPYWNEVRSWNYEVYEWVNGPPHAFPDPNFTSNPAYCGDPFTERCPNMKCDVEFGETYDNCSQDCTNSDDICDPYEKMQFEMSPSSQWADDCGNCGDTYCDDDSESPMNCEMDCGTCGNGVCNEVDSAEFTDECHLDEVNGLRCTTDCCTGTMTVCSHMAHSFCQ